MHASTRQAARWLAAVDRALELAARCEKGEGEEGAAAAESKLEAKAAAKGEGGKEGGKPEPAKAPPKSPKGEASHST